jgi:glycerophosphoryl diester phosphodiesterase
MNQKLFPCLGLIVMSTIASAADATSPAARLLETKRPLVIAHRGYSQFAPENTLPAFQLAMAAGADMVELDYYHSKDGELVVMHDPTLDRTTDAIAKWGGSKIRLDSKSLAELQMLDAGKWFKPEFAGTKVPTLAESLDLIQAGNMTLIERKAGDAAACVKMLQARGLVNKLVVQAFDWSYLADFHALEPAQILGALGPPATKEGRKLTEAEKLLTKEWIDQALKSGVRVIGWNHQVTKEAVDYAHGKGLKVWVYTINDQAEATRLLNLGVDGLITNNTSLMWRSIAERKANVGP